MYSFIKELLGEPKVCFPSSPVIDSVRADPLNISCVQKHGSAAAVGCVWHRHADTMPFNVISLQGAYLLQLMYQTFLEVYTLGNLK